jgi:hypothetical protein
MSVAICTPTAPAPMTTICVLRSILAACLRRYVVPASFSEPGSVEGGESFVPVVMAWRYQHTVVKDPDQ